MRPTHLSIEGLASYRTLQEIDFGDLDLFVITGPTGAGKTSILDAITFALYGDVCRVKGGQLRDLISHGATHLKVSLDFRVNGSTYRVARRMRKVGPGHDVQFVRVEGEEEILVTDAAGVKAIDASIEDVLGLDFSAFTKAVLLPQGAFHEFLQGDASARRQILIRLLDLNRYLRVGAKAREHAKLLKARLEERAKLIESEYGDATSEALKSAKKNEKTTKASFKELQSLETKAKEHIGTAQAREAATLAAAECEESFRQLEGDVAVFAEELSPLKVQLEVRTREAVDSVNAVRSAEKQVAAAESSLAKLIKKFGDEAALARLQASAESLTTEGATLIALGEQLAGARENLAAANATHADALDAAKNAKAACTEAALAATKAEAACELSASLLEYARAADDEHVARLQLEQLANEREEAIAAAEAAKDHLSHLQHADFATTLRAELRAGDTCPVCETTIATLPKIERGTATLLKKAQDAKELADSRHLDAEKAYATAKQTHATAAKRAAGAKGALPPKTKPVSAADTEHLCAEAEAARTKADGELSERTQAKTDAEAHATGADAKSREGKARCDGIEQEVAAAKQRLKGAESKLSAAFSSKLPAELDSVLAERLQQVREARQAGTNAAANLKTSQDTSAESVARQHQAEGMLANLAERFAETRAKVELNRQALEQVARATLPPLPDSHDDFDVQVETLGACCPAYLKAAEEAGRDAAKSRDQAIRSIATLLAPLELTFGEDLDEVLEALAARRESAHGTMIQAQAAAAALKDKIAKRAELEHEIETDTVRSALYKTLGQELHQDNFIAFVLTESMESLAALASVELLLISGERYSLVAEDSGFDVVDHHNADERRSVATLSGGETFLASLALALALAGSVRDLAGTAAAARLDTIFIDEGFGALDPETLDVVVDALERLREGNRMVGVISHVAELAERIPQGLVVSKNGGVSTVAAR